MSKIMLSIGTATKFIELDIETFKTLINAKVYRKEYLESEYREVRNEQILEFQIVPDDLVKEYTSPIGAKNESV